MSSWSDQPHAVVFPDEWHGPMPERIENADPVSFGHYRTYLGFPHPAESGNFGVLFQDATHRTAPEDQSHDSPAHVLVDASKRNWLNDEPSLFPDFAQQTLCYSLVTLKDAAGWFPVRIISPLDYERAAVLVDHNTSNAYRVARVLAGHR
jgi:hypothetical protein